MHEEIVLGILLLQCTLCLNIRVPVDWNNDSEVKEQFSNTEQIQAPIYHEYFKYTAKKPQFAIDIAAAHDVPSPENHYKSYPIKPHTGLTRPVLGQHRIVNSDNTAYEPYQKFVHSGDFVTPVKTSYEVYHPYTAEQPSLQKIYKDPVLDKIRNDLRDTKHRLQKYENEAGESDISKEEYLESPEQTDRKKIPHKNIPVQYELHRPQRRPIYYHLPVRPNHREQILNHKLRHPWNQNIKVTPNHYRPVKKHLQRLRQQHALKYDDDHNEYPQLSHAERYEGRPDGYDIYEKGKEKYMNLRNNFDESLNKIKLQNTPKANYNLEMQNESIQGSNEATDEEEFVPIKNYAQVRKVETTKHLPRTAALHDAENYEEIQNAPRLREAIKSSKAQIVYSEEGYEDAAYDHAGEQKHASNHEGHGGYLKENEISGGKFKIPSVSSGFADSEGVAYRDQLLHGKKWKDDKKENQDETDSDDYSEDEEEHDLSGDVIIDKSDGNNDNDRYKRDNKAFSPKNIFNENKLSEKHEKDINKNSRSTDHTQHDVTKRETTFRVPEFEFNSTLPADNGIDKLIKIIKKSHKIKKENNKEKLFKKKYPYYSGNIKNLNKNSPLRYAENIKLIPKKSSGGTEFYDSRSKYECPNVEDEVDPIPDKLKKDGHPDDNENTSDDKAKGDKFESLKNTKRLQGLGDKIDCFKTKYFGENPLDSPFFREDIIESPEQVTRPNLAIFKTNKPAKNSNNKLVSDDADIFTLLVKVNNNRKQAEKFPQTNNNYINDTSLVSQSNVYKNLLSIIEKNLDEKKEKVGNEKRTDAYHPNTSYASYRNKEDVTKPSVMVRKKRTTGFMYEPYKIIRDSQVQDSKKTTTTSNIGPLIKQLQSSRVIDKVTLNTDKDHTFKNNIKMYKDIGKTDRQKLPNTHLNDSNYLSFVNVSPDSRGEPRFEFRPTNHKPAYSPVANKRAISIDDYKLQMNQSDSDTQNNTKLIQPSKKIQQKRSSSPKTTSRPYFDVSKYLPRVVESQSIAASNAVQKVVQNSPDATIESLQHNQNSDNDDEYDEYTDEDEEKLDILTTTTTTTKRPIRKRIRLTTSTNKPAVTEIESERPKLHLTTRFRNNQPTEKSRNRDELVEESPYKRYNHESNTPKYTEKTRKSTKSTLVTDTKTYGNDDDDDTRKEVDALLHVKQNMDEYMPRYEKNRQAQEISVLDDRGDDDDVDDDDDDDDGDKREHISDNDSSDEDDDDEEEDHEEKDVDNNDDEEENNDRITNKEDEDKTANNSHNSRHRNHEKTSFKPTTSEPTKRTLLRTTIAPPTTTESKRARIALKPTILEKKIEINEETPVDRSSPHISRFKQNFKEIEILKEIPPKQIKRKNNQNLEALRLYRDENLAEEINKLGDVEIFKENLDVDSSPKHGGNYRSITPKELQREKEMITAKSRDAKIKDDVETSQTEAKKIKLDDVVTFKSIIPKALSSVNAKNAKYSEFSDSVETHPRSMHGGNLKSSRNTGTRHNNNNKSEKLIELDYDEEDETSNMHGDTFKTNGYRNTGRPMHGGNYKSAKIVQTDDTTEKSPKTRGRTRDARTNAAVLLDSYARAVPVLTTAPPFILDPSKRMYYYVDA